MSILVKIWIFELDFRTVLSFIIGLFFGMILLGLIYALLVVISLRDKKYRVEVNPENLRQEEAIEMVRKAQEAFKDRELRGKLTKTQYFRRLTIDLVYGIAASFYPNSKYPLLEITVDEAIELIGYVQYRLDDMLNKKILRLFKKLRISSIVAMSLSTQSVLDNKAFQVTKNVTVKASKFKKAVDTVNPLKWFKRIFVDTSIDRVINKIFLVTLGIIGEEAYKIYSKSVLKEEETIDTNVEELADSIESDLKEAMEDDEVEKIRFKTRVLNPNKLELNYESNYDMNYRFKEKMAVEVTNEEE